MTDQNTYGTTSSIRLLRLPEVQHMTGMGRSTIWKRAREGSFPAPVKQGPRTTGWIEGQVVQWISDLMPKAA